MPMVIIIHMFLRAEKEGDWLLPV